MRLLPLPWELVGVLLASASINPLCASASSAVNVAVKASFDAAPYLLELLETAAEENSTSYFPLLDRIAEGYFADDATEQDLYTRFLKLLQDDGHITDPDALSSFQFALSIHSAAPRIEAHYQYYTTSVEQSLMVGQDAACPVWVHFNGKQYCSPSLERAQQDFKGSKDPQDLPFDRVLGESAQAPSSIIYADITSPLFGQFHQIISRTARKGQSSYRLRYRPSPAASPKPLMLSGYGVELALKRTDYIVIDDRNAEKGEEAEETISSEAEDVSLEAGEMADLKPLSSAELLGLGLKAASFILESEAPFDTLIKVSQDFPRHSSAITKGNANVEFVTEHRSNRELFLPAGYNVIFMNGMQIDARQMDAFALLEQLRKERKLIGGLRDLGLTGSESVQLLSHPAIAQSKIEDVSQRYDYRDTLEGGNIIIWLNNIEKDKRYEGWPTHANALLQRTYPGQLPTVRRDIHNLIMVLDLSDLQDTEMLVDSLYNFVQRKVGIRFGVVPSLKSAAAIDQAKIAYHLLDTYGLSAVITYLQSSVQGRKAVGPSKGNFESTVKDRKLRKDRAASSLQVVLEADESLDRLENVRRYLSRLAADGASPPIFVNGLAIPRNEGWLQAMSSRVELDLRTIQRAVFEEAIGEDAWLAGQFLEGAATHRNALIIPEDESSIVIVDMGTLIKEHEHIYRGLPHLMPKEDTLKQFWAHLIVMADFDTPEGSKLVAEAVEYAKQQGEVEIVLFHNPSTSENTLRPISSAVFDLLLKGLELDSDELFLALKGSHKLDDSDNPMGVPGMDISGMAAAYWEAMQALSRSIGLEAGEQGLVLNGRFIGPIPRSAGFSSADYRQLLEYERSKRLAPANTALAALGLEERIDSPLSAAILSSLIALSTVSDVPEGIFETGPTLRMNRHAQWNASHSAITTGDAATASIEVVASIDPTSEIAQRWIPILKVLSELSGVHMKLFLNPKERMQELPVKRFYRHVLDAKPSFDKEGSLKEPRATFEGLPKEALLNLALDVPPAWLVAPKESIHDLDNIKLSALKEDSNIDAIYELEHILIEGHSKDVTLGPPPRGVQLLLGTEKDPHAADTIIMANLGYFQFKANPGYWKIQLQEGRSQQIFNIDSVGAEGYNPKPGDERTDIALMSFQGKTLYPRLSRKPNHEMEDVLEEGSKAGSTMDFVSKGFKFAETMLSNVGLTKQSQQADINIFSVASGHLYERMLNIMMVSVMRHTKHTVKFWFIDQFLSPSFKSFLPHLAAHYHFDYETVTYKWPHWLRGQKEKQREIWGYKILFLDVLFPLSLDKVIFVDADQIVRTDMHDLVTLDLHGAPYGFTPMCDSRREMEGFRFWKQGYWKSFLRGLPYHISALYVVDLRRFRQMAAGDRLRQQYHQLSADENSLSNLDQDLPNHMQMVLPIFSLPQDWLWCETWCSDESLREARTIDLCNNPLTHEPKLDRARRQVPEWTVYDEEIAVVARG
ncbi:MAG: glycosyltransferase family 24 [Lasallia pustulata]|uniref:Glycosyltransferase family 24 n=1 Tax=Lasallia pustulata TaxID=136370 RepID=A0A5M8PQW4_9LECA|nr:MAG: glycosyltransferase family 24 [Lasallia pustulata]